MFRSTSGTASSRPAASSSAMTGRVAAMYSARSASLRGSTKAISRAPGWVRACVDGADPERHVDLGIGLVGRHDAWSRTLRR